jgi:hypothetical protein
MKRTVWTHSIVPWIFGNGATAILALTSVLALSLLYVFKGNNAQLKQEIERIERKTYPAVGDYVPDAPAALLAANVENSMVLGAGNGATVFYFFSPDCKFCESEKEKLPYFYASARSRGYRFVAVSTAWPNETRRMFPHPVSFPILAESGGGIARSYRVAGTPIFITVSESRRISAVHLGVLPREKFQAEMLR